MWLSQQDEQSNIPLSNKGSLCYSQDHNQIKITSFCVFLRLCICVCVLNQYVNAYSYGRLCNQTCFNMAIQCQMLKLYPLNCGSRDDNHDRWSQFLQIGGQKCGIMVAFIKSCHGHDRMVVGFTTTCAISAYQH